jgi:hypothetical protein
MPMNPYNKIAPYSEKSIERIEQENFEAISLYYNTGESIQLSKDQKVILDRMRTAHALLSKYPRKRVAMRKLRLRYPEISERQAMRDISFAMQLWNKYNPIDRDFLEQYFLDKLLAEISDPSAPAVVTSKNLATLEKYLSNLPPEKIDPKLMEKNNIYIQFNMNNQKINVPEAVLKNLPADIRNQFLGSINNEITEDIAAQIMKS